MEKKYNPLVFEEQIYQNWLDKNYFYAKVNKKKTPFTIIMPPPNITSKLHMGHAFQQTIQDIIIRRKRMQGFEALWLPGTDHAAIATEAKVVEKLRKEGLNKEDIGREEFGKHIQAWYTLYKDTIMNQFKRMGYSCDWSKVAFTMDEQNCRAVREVFVRLYKKGYIYRGKRIVNWCPTCKTSISDIEVEFEPNHGHLWHLRYQIEGTNDFIELATTRPETLLGDTAVAVNPKDKRYKKLVGKNVILPLVNRPIPIIADHYVDMEFGTGVVKITPAHDPNDFEVGTRHGLEKIVVIGLDGKMNENAGKYAGMDRYEARKVMVEDLQKSGNLVKIEDYDNNVGHCSRCHSVIEPMISPQWYVKMSELAKPAIKVVEEDKVHFVEERYKKIYLHWMKNVQDWCISRQLWSGHRIPVFTCDECGHEMCELTDPVKCAKCGSTHLSQDPDTLDTWFSSALWPFSTLGFPDKTPELEYFYPTDVMVTAQDIIQLWVARMIFSSLEYVGEIPFREVLINGIVKADDGRKMSKSLGNGVDPIEIINKYGVDTLRFSLFNGISIDMDSRFSEKKVELNRNFINKVWNASLFVLHAIEGKKVKKLSDVNLSDADKWIVNEINELTKSVNHKFDKYDIGMAASELYDFFWTKFCDWYIEISKVNMELYPESTASTLVFVLTTLLKLLHPFIPFVTEQIYQELPMHEETIMLSAFPEYSKELSHKVDAKRFDELRSLVRLVRNMRAESGVADNKKINLFVLPLKDKAFVKRELAILQKLCTASSVSLVEVEEMPNSKVVVGTLAKVFVPMDDIINVAEEIERLVHEIAKCDAEIARANGKLNNAGFVAKAPANLVEEEREKVIKYQALKQEFETTLKGLKK
ncbi:MAG: valine--tRNA ligase [Clostridia bacterium]|nr:valine--tRNA ligase [Clostridia bacterium]